MIFHKHIFVFSIAIAMCIALFVLYLPGPAHSVTTTQYRSGCFTCRCQDQAGKKVILGPICNYRSSLAQDVQNFTCNQTAATAQCQELSALQGLDLVSVHIWRGF